DSRGHAYRRSLGKADASPRKTDRSGRNDIPAVGSCRAPRSRAPATPGSNSRDAEVSYSLLRRQVSCPLPHGDAGKVILEIKNREEKRHNATETKIDGFHAVVVF